MSERTTNFMASLDEWTDTTILRPWFTAVENALNHRDDPNADKALWDWDAKIKKAVREKVLESYRNGQAAGASKFKKS